MAWITNLSTLFLLGQIIVLVSSLALASSPSQRLMCTFPSGSDPSSLTFAGTSVEMTERSSVIVNVSSPLFEGQACAMLRSAKPAPSHPDEAPYDFGGDKEILWEYQLQGRFKRPLKGPLYLSLELPQTDKYSVSIFVRSLISAVLKFIKSWGYRDLALSYGGSGTLPHLSCPLYQTCDRINATSGAPPLLGSEVPEPGESTCLRRAFSPSGIQGWETGKVYTFSFNHTYLDLRNWQVVGVPLVRPFRVFAPKLRLAFYEYEDGGAGSEAGMEEEGGGGYDVMKVARGKHEQGKKNYLTWFQIEGE